MGAHKNIRSRSGLAALKRMRRLCADLPEVEEHVDGFGHTSFRVRDKPFVIMGEGEGKNGASLSVKAATHAQPKLIASGRFEKTPYIGQHGWVSTIKLPPKDWNELESLVVDAYARTAPTSLSRKIAADD